MRNKQSLWILAEDFVAVLIGPFADQTAVQKHLQFMDKREDSAHREVITDFVAKFVGVSPITPEEDREFDPKGE